MSRHIDKVYITISKSVSRSSMRLFIQQRRKTTKSAATESVHKEDNPVVSSCTVEGSDSEDRPPGTVSSGLSYRVKEWNFEASDDLQNLLGVNVNQAKAILKKLPQLQFNIQAISPTLSYLKDKKQVSITRIFNHPWLLLMEPEIIDQKVKEVMTILEIDEFEAALPFVNLKYPKICQIAFVWKKEAELEPALQNKNNNIRSRLQFLAFTLECPGTADVADMMAKVDSLKTMPFSRLETVLTILLDGGVHKEDIRSDPWIFEHNIDTMRDRLIKSRLRGLSKIKPWILRSPEEKFETHVDRMVAEQALLKGHKDVSSFLQQRLGCSKMTAKEILFRVPSIKTASAMKLNEMIQFLYSQGFTADHIVETPRILGHSVDTIAARIKELSSYDYQPYSLLKLCKTSKHYSSFIRRLRHETLSKKQVTEE